ncbi:tRNA(m5U54)methyltransferase [Gnomoniopsis sp. IMI 355080]|nr:tRNA(m5U54)methyltransferase [Gnomoniopsis sp. IMI 355080]
MASVTSLPPLEAPSNGDRKRAFNGAQGGVRGQRQQKKMRKAKSKPVKEGSAEQVLMADLRAMLAAQKLEDHPDGDEVEGNAEEEEELPEPGTEIDVVVQKLSSTGDGLAQQPGRRQIYVVPFAVPGDTVRIKVFRHLPQDNHSIGDFISVTKPGPLRDDSRIFCQYFSKCSGCQFQMLSYADQLAHKRTIVSRAYQTFSQLAPELVPAIGETMGSPLQSGYRTKLTPHFDGPPGSIFKKRGTREKKFLEQVPEIGFMKKGSGRTIDIEDCPIGTDAVRKGMARERARMRDEYGKYERGATILLRENTTRVPKGEALPDPFPKDAVSVETERFTDVKTCITDNNATSTEYIEDFIFTNPAGSFFQNNNSILPSFTDYIRQHILPPPSEGAKPIKTLIDAYSGSGLFTITLSSLFSGGSIGIDIAEKSINFARTNAKLNNLPEEQCKFIAADAPELFKSVKAFDADETVVVLDPPRKGCDASFLRQLLAFGPRRVVYVSCNVHTQARDVGVLVRGEVSSMQGGESVAKQEGDESGEEKSKVKTRYEIESIRGFDFFPQTGHVEGVAVLNRVVEA